jgi:hypothetical protein
VDIQMQVTDQERRTLENAKTVLKALIMGEVCFFGFFCIKGRQESLRISQIEMHDAVRLLNRLGFVVSRVDSGAYATWRLEDCPEDFLKSI